MKLQLTILILFFSLTTQLNAQGIINQIKSESDGIPTVGCGSYEFMEQVDHHSTGFMEVSDQLLKDISKVADNNKVLVDIYNVPVVFS